MDLYPKTVFFILLIRAQFYNGVSALHVPARKKASRKVSILYYITVSLSVSQAKYTYKRANHVIFRYLFNDILRAQ